MSRVAGRAPHAILDISSRRYKALKIVTLLREAHSLEGARMLDIGTGAGVTAALLAEVGGPEAEVLAVDVVDQRQMTEGVQFVQIEGTGLPFDDRSFDIVVSNHVIEHVGGRDEQLDHLREFHRVLKDDGCGYLGAPNRWGVLEPHFRLPFLSWLPPSLRSPYVSLTRRGDTYDCDPPSHRELVELLDGVGLAYTERTFEAMRAMARIETPRWPVRRLLEAPERILRVLHPVIPIMIFLVRRGPSSTQ
jgi:ubiquinone/menaquinone biosynthesis C-methylase UbiE